MNDTGVIGWLFIATWIDFALVLALFSITDWFEDDNKNQNRNKILCSILMLTILIFPTIVISTMPEVVTYERYEIISLNDNIGSHSDFFIGSGTVDSVSRYYFYKKVGVGYMQGSIPASYTLIVMDENDNPYVNVTIKNGITEGYELHVPNNTIVREYNLNGK
jgi:hypothetical protein